MTPERDPENFRNFRETHNVTGVRSREFLRFSRINLVSSDPNISLPRVALVANFYSSYNHNNSLSNYVYLLRTWLLDIKQGGLKSSNLH